MSMNIPLLLIVWRRPDALRDVINAIRPVEPSRMFIACDGPKPDSFGDIEKIAATRDVVEKEIDWPLISNVFIPMLIKDVDKVQSRQLIGFSAKLKRVSY